ncbi:MAG: O-antigen ligase family protein [Bacteroidales bacterium]|nr:O-antigen ligase family protein [Bacteroidales bacterium]
MKLGTILHIDRQLIHDSIYFFGLCLLVMATPTSRYMMSVSQLLIAMNWFFEGHFREKFRRFSECRAAWLFAGIFGIHILGLSWSSDIMHGIFDDMKDKLPTLTLTFFLVSSKPLSKHRLYVLLWLFSASVVLASIAGLIVYHTGSYVDGRKVMPFIPHVYFSMMVVFVMVLLPWLTHQYTVKPRLMLASYAAVLWLLVYLFILSSITGLLCLAGVVVFLAAREVLTRKNVWLRAAAVVLLLAATGISVGITYKMYRNVNKVVPLEKNYSEAKTSLGNPYTHYDHSDLRENGHLVFHFIAEDELRSAWNERSTLDYDGSDLTGQALSHTLFRYMSSLGLRKDKEGLKALGDDDIHAVETGIPNYLYLKWPKALVRLHQTVWEVYQYRKTGNPTGHTFSQRLELWRASYRAFLEKPVLGWGTGDIYIAVDFGLNEINSQMANFRMKPHNQFLLFLLLFGAAGSFAIYALYVLYIRRTNAYKYLPFNVFLIIMLISMTGNNPYDAQTGQTFFCIVSLFFGALLNRHENSKGKPASDNTLPESSN